MRSRERWMLYVARGGIRTLIRRYVFYPFIRYLVGQLCNFTLPLAAAYSHPANFVCSGIDHIRYAAYRQQELPRVYRIPSAPFYIPYFIAIPALSIKHNIFNGIYILPALQFSKNLSSSNNYDGRGTMLLSQNLPVRVAPSVLLPIVFLQTLHPYLLRPRPPPSLASDRPQPPDPKQQGGSLLRQDPFILQQSAHAGGYRSRQWGYVGAGLYRRWQWVIQADIRQAALKGKVFGAWVGCEDSWVLLEYCRHSWRIWTCERFESYWLGQNGVELRAGGSCLGAHRATLVGATPFKCVFVGVICCPHIHLATVAGQGAPSMNP